MMEDFVQSRASQNADSSLPTLGMTRQLSCDLNAIFKENLPDADKKAALVKYMVDHSGEFFGYKKKVSKAVRDTDGKIKIGKDKKAVKEEVEQEIFLHGYSRSCMNKFLRLAKYLAVLYPEYLIVNDKSIFKNETEGIKYDAEGNPLLTSLFKAVFQANEWQNIVRDGGNQAPTEGDTQYISPKVLSKQWGVTEKQIVKYCEQHRIPGAVQQGGTWIIPEDVKKPSEFEDAMFLLCNNYEQHLNAVERLIRGENSVEFFERRDALLFIYFLINGYIKLIQRASTRKGNAYSLIDEMLGLNSDEKTKTAVAHLDNMFDCGDDFDYAVAEALEKAKFALFDAEDTTIANKRFQILVESFNLILTQMGYTNLYLPARFDRFVILALLSGSPEELTPLIMSQEELGYYESET